MSNSLLKVSETMTLTENCVNVN